MTKREPENSVGKQAGRWPKGRSGNPAGKPRGATNLVTRAIEDLLEGSAEKLTQKCVAMALKGDGTAMRLCFERLAPVRKGRPVSLALPQVKSAADLVKAHAEVVRAMAGGEISPDEAAVVASVLEAKRKTMEMVDIEDRLRKVEDALARR